MPEPPLQPVESRAAVELTYAPIRRPIHRGAGAMLRQWARANFTRESLLSSLKSLLWVAPLTVLIWIYAEREQVGPATNQPLTIEVRSNDPGRVVKLISPPTGSIRADLRGPQAALEKVKELLQSSAIPIEIPRDLPRGELTIPIDTQLNQLPMVKSAGVTISNVMPGEVRVMVEPIVSREISVMARPADRAKLTSPPIFNPRKVRIFAPQSLLERAEALARSQGAELVAYAELGSFKEMSDPGKHTLAAVPVVPSVRLDDTNVRLSPTGVSVDINVRAQDERYTLPYIRVLAASPPGQPAADQYKPVFDPTITHVTVVGPPEQVELLKEGKAGEVPKFTPLATFEVDYSDPKSPPPPAKLWYQLPPGVQISPEDRDRTATITYSFAQRSTVEQ